jgi:hypothetical protein
MDYLNVDELRAPKAESEKEDRPVVDRRGSGEQGSIFAALKHVVRDALADQLGAMEERLLRRVADLVQNRLELADSASKRELAAMHARLARLEERAIDMQATLAELEGDLKRRRRASFS